MVTKVGFSVLGIGANSLDEIRSEPCPEREVHVTGCIDGVFKAIVFDENNGCRLCAKRLSDELIRSLVTLIGQTDLFVFKIHLMKIDAVLAQESLGLIALDAPGLGKHDDIVVHGRVKQLSIDSNVVGHRLYLLTLFDY